MFYPIMPNIPTNNIKPPTVYALLQSAVNFENPEQVSIKDLAKSGRHKIFNFEYPLSEKLDKEKFESMILKHFLMRRIGFQTLTAFQIQLDVKLNEIMPIYNKMFDSIDGWNLFEDGEKTTHKLTDERETSAENTMETNSTTSGTNESDNRNSDMPQAQIDNIKDGKYLTNYTFNQDKNNSEDNSTSSGTSSGTDKHTLNEEWSKSPADKIAIYKEFQENIKSIYGMIFKDLECLFYQLI